MRLVGRYLLFTIGIVAVTLLGFLPKIANAASGVHLSTSQIGSTATLTAEIPPDPCGTFKLGESKIHTIDGFAIMAPRMNGQVAEQNRPFILDLSEARIRNVMIAGKEITSYHRNLVETEPLNAADVLPVYRRFDLDSPITFNTSDTASITVDNVKILEKGSVQVTFDLSENGRFYCVESMPTTIMTGTNITKTMGPAPTAQPTPVLTSTPSAKESSGSGPMSLGIASNGAEPTSHQPSQPETKKSAWDEIISFLGNLFSWVHIGGK